MQVAGLLCRNRHLGRSRQGEPSPAAAPGTSRLPRQAARGDQQCPSPPGYLRSPVAVTASTPAPAPHEAAPPAVPSRRFRLPAGPAAVTQARAHVRAAVRDWDLPVSEGMAVLLTWHLVMSVTSDVTSEGPGGADGTEGPAGPAAPRAGEVASTLALGVSCSRGA